MLDSCGTCCLAEAKTTYRHSYQWMQDSHTRVSQEIVTDDIMTDVNVLKMEDGRVEACLTMGSKDHELMQMRKENLEITRTQQYIDSNVVTVQIAVCSQEQAWQGRKDHIV